MYVVNEMEITRERESRTDISNTSYGNPPWRFKGRAVYQLHLVKSQIARSLIPKEFRLVEAFGYTLGGFFYANYDHSPAGVFDELVVIPGIVWNPPTSCAWASKVLVSSNEACLHGRTEVGLPSHVARFTKLQNYPEQEVTVDRRQQDGRFSRFLRKMSFSSSKPRPEFNLMTQVTEISGHDTDKDIFSINLLSSLPKETAEGWLGPQIKMSLPSFSGRTQYNPSLLKYSCQMECRVQVVHPLRILRASPTNDLRAEQQYVKEQNPSSVHGVMEENIEKNTLSLFVMLSKPLLAVEFNCLSMNVEAPLTISE